MNYIDELYKQMLASQGRAPANAAFDEVLTTGQKAPAGTSFVGDELTPLSTDEVDAIYKKNPNLQRQEKIGVIGERPVPIEYPEKYKVQVPQSEIIRENVNEALIPMMQEAQSMSENVTALTKQSDADRDALRKSLQKMRDIDFKEYQNPGIDSLIKTQQEKMLTQGAEIPERDLATELILNLGPALGGMFLGEAGALAAPTAFKQSREIYEGQRKEQIERVKLLKDNSEKKLKALIDAKKSGQEAFDKTQERELKKAQYELEGGKALAQQSTQELDKTEQRLMLLNQEIARQRGARSVDIAKMERSKWESEQKTKRAPRFQKPPDLPLDQKKMVERYATEVARITGINSQVSELKKQIGDKSISETDRVASANEQLKLLNSTLGADAVGAEEVGRMAAYLEFKPNYVKRKLGPDLEGFYRQLDRVNQRLSGTISAQQREIDKIYGRPVKSTSVISSGQKKPQGPSIVEKIINGQKRKFQLNPATGKYKEVK